MDTQFCIVPLFPGDCALLLWFCASNDLQLWQMWQMSKIVASRSGNRTGLAALSLSSWLFREFSKLWWLVVTTTTTPLALLGAPPRGRDSNASLWLQSRPGNKGPKPQDPVAHNGVRSENGGHKLIKTGAWVWASGLGYFSAIRLSSFAFHNCQEAIPNDFDPIGFDPDFSWLISHCRQLAHFCFCLETATETETEIRSLTGFHSAEDALLLLLRSLCSFRQLQLTGSCLDIVVVVGLLKICTPPRPKDNLCPSPVSKAHSSRSSRSSSLHTRTHSECPSAGALILLLLFRTIRLSCLPPMGWVWVGLAREMTTASVSAPLRLIGSYCCLL